MSDFMEYKSLGNLLDELNEEKLYIEQAPPPQEESRENITLDSSDDFDNEAETDERPSIQNLPMFAELIVGLIDMLFAQSAAMFSHGDKTDYRLDSEEKDEYVKAWKMYLENTPDFKLSPSTTLIMSSAVIFLPKTIQAFNERKENKRIRELEAQLESEQRKTKKTIINDEDRENT